MQSKKKEQKGNYAMLTNMLKAKVDKTKMDQIYSQYTNQNNTFGTSKETVEDSVSELSSAES